MSAIDRRHLLRLAIAAALAPALASRKALAHGQTRAISPPSGEMIYRRTLERFLRGDARLVVRRDFSVHFERIASGFRIDGQQVLAQVDAPANLAALAQLERQRVERGVFPLELDPHGHIVTGGGVVPSLQVSAALDLTLRSHRSAAYAGPDPADIITLVETLHQSGQRITSELPTDLFAPAAGSRQEQQELVLPTGDTGQVTTSFHAAIDPVTGLMREASREVVTAIAGDLRRTRETWELRPA